VDTPSLARGRVADLVDRYGTVSDCEEVDALQAAVGRVAVLLDVVSVLLPEASRERAWLREAYYQLDELLG